MLDRFGRATPRLALVHALGVLVLALELSVAEEEGVCSPFEIPTPEEYDPEQLAALHEEVRLWQETPRYHHRAAHGEEASLRQRVQGVFPIVREEGEDEAGGGCSCERFCQGQCSMERLQSMPQKLRLFRRSGAHLRGAVGDANFEDTVALAFLVLRDAALPVLCRDEPKWRPCTRMARLAGTETIHQVDVEVSGEWGPYARCDGVGVCRHELCPSLCPSTQDPEERGCVACGRAWALPGASPLADRYPQPTGTRCKRTNSTFADCERPWEVWKYALSQKMTKGPGGGHLISLPKAGECAEGQEPSPQGCSWTVPREGKAVSLHCVRERVFHAVEEWGAPCFDTCATGRRRGDICYIRCFFDTLLGNTTVVGADLVTVQPSWIVNKLQQAFANPAQGGCPGV